MGFFPPLWNLPNVCIAFANAETRFDPKLHPQRKTWSCRQNSILIPKVRDRIPELRAFIDVSIEDDDLPPVSEAFGVPIMLMSKPAPAPQLPSTSTASTSRFSVRATTFDGKTIFIRRKPKVNQEARRVSGLQRLLQTLGLFIIYRRKSHQHIILNAWETCLIFPFTVSWMTYQQLRLLSFSKSKKTDLSFSMTCSYHILQ